jgi:AcrR family transcriptional regulator
MVSRARRMAPEARREQLLDVLADLVLTEGYAAVSIDRVAREASIARTVVYAQFGNLDVMLEALVDRTQQRAVGQVRAILAGSGTPPDPADIDTTIVTAIRTFGEMVTSDPRTWRLALLRSDGAPPVVRERSAVSRRAIRELLQPAIRWITVERGGLEGVENELAARSLVTLGEDAARLMVSDPDTYPPDRIADFTKALLEALRT